MSLRRRRRIPGSALWRGYEHAVLSQLPESEQNRVKQQINDRIRRHPAHRWIVASNLIFIAVVVVFHLILRSLAARGVSGTFGAVDYTVRVAGLGVVHAVARATSISSR